MKCATSTAGRFCETLRIENLQDPDNLVTLTVKALVRKRETFVLGPASLDFGRCLDAERSKTTRIELSNMTSASRAVLLRHTGVVLDSRIEALGGVDAVREMLVPDLAVAVQYTLEKCQVVDEKVNKEEELEKMERKLRIYERKGKRSKALKMREKMNAMLGKPFGGETNSDGTTSETASPEGSEKSYLSDDAYSSDDQSDAEESDWQWRQGKTEKESAGGQCTVFLPGQGVQTILITITVSLEALGGTSVGRAIAATLRGPGWAHVMSVRGKLVAHELADRDTEKSIDFSLAYLPAERPSPPLDPEPGLSMVKALQKEKAVDDVGVLPLEKEKGGAASTLREYRAPRLAGGEEDKSALVIEPQTLDLKEVPLGEEVVGELTVLNSGATSVSFIFMNPSGGKKEKDLLSEGKAKKKEDAAKEDAKVKGKEGEGGVVSKGASASTTPLVSKGASAKGDAPKGFKFSTQQSKLEGGVRQTVTFWCVPEVAGRQVCPSRSLTHSLSLCHPLTTHTHTQSHALIIRDITSGVDNIVTVSFTARKVYPRFHPTYLPPVSPRKFTPLAGGERVVVVRALSRRRVGARLRRLLHRALRDDPPPPLPQDSCHAHRERAPHAASPHHTIQPRQPGTHASTRWATTLSSKDNLPSAINFGSLCCANLVTLRSKF